MTADTEIQIPAPPDRVWAFLAHADRVVRCLPGCRDVETLAPGLQYATTISERAGPFKVVFPLQIRVLAVEPPARMQIQASGRDAALGTALTVVLDLHVHPAAEGSGTRLAIRADTDVAGRLAAFGRGIMHSKAKGLLAHFAETLRKELEADATPAPNP